MKQQSGNVKDSNQDRDLKEEIAAEITPDVGLKQAENVGMTGAVMLGYAAIAISLLSFFFMPLFLGIIAMVLSVVSLGRGAYLVGGWAMSIALLSLGWFLLVRFI